MDAKLKQELNWLFKVYESRTENLVKALPESMQTEFDEELELFKAKILNWVSQELDR